MYPRYVPTRQSYDIKPAPKTWFAKIFAQILRIIYHVVGTFCMSWVRDRYRGCILNDIVGTMYICRGEHKITMSCVHVVGNTELPYLGVHIVGTYRGYRNLCRGYICWILILTSWMHIVDTYRGYMS